MNKYNSGEDRNHWKDWKKEKSKNQIVSDAIETNVKIHEKFNSTFDESGGSSLQKPLRLKRKLSKRETGISYEFVDNDNIDDIEEFHAEKKLEDHRIMMDWHSYSKSLKKI
ncbi:17809_t:CDS:2 [Funneliformis caledonium]|uniref:17809_t:CDS:1 n=1 Tax=Funneliformis caledonium TaxID=1117310 RepID=A0A9N9H3K0_9GLOM|nr:17809_t:CDS:2 [Funneliformis caledonium]